MVNKVFLLWQAYTNEWLLIGILNKVDNKYVFKYDKEAIKAKNLNCFLPFTYTDEELIFDSLPSFFSQRILTGKFNESKYGIKYNPANELALLTYGDGRKNSDSFHIVDEKRYKKLVEMINNENNNENRYVHK